MAEKRKYLIYLGIACVCCVILSRIALRPLIAKSTDLNRQIQLKKQTVKEAISLLSRKESIQKEFAQLANFFKQGLSVEGETAAFLKEIESIAKAVPVLLVDLKPASAERKDFYLEYKIELTAEAEMSQLITFLYNLQNSKEILRVQQLHLSPKTDIPNMFRAHLIVTRALAL